MANAFALHGYLNSWYSNVIKDGYDECVHTSYFDQETDGVAQCGEAKVTKNNNADTVLKSRPQQ